MSETLTGSPFTEEEELYRRTLRQFIQRELEPHYMNLGTDRESRRKLWRAAGQAGILGGWIPEEYGGPGASTFCNVILAYELGRSPAYATLGSLIATDLGGALLVSGGADALLRKWAPKIL